MDPDYSSKSSDGSQGVLDYRIAVITGYYLGQFEQLSGQLDEFAAERSNLGFEIFAESVFLRRGRGQLLPGQD